MAALGRAGATASAASARPAAAVTSSVRGVTGFTSESTVASTSASGVSRVIVCIGSDAAAIFPRLTLLASEYSVYLNKAADTATRTGLEAWRKRP